MLAASVCVRAASRSALTRGCWPSRRTGGSGSADPVPVSQDCHLWREQGWADGLGPNPTPLGDFLKPSCETLLGVPKQQAPRSPKFSWSKPNAIPDPDPCNDHAMLPLKASRKLLSCHISSRKPSLTYRLARNLWLPRLQTGLPS